MILRRLTLPGQAVLGLGLGMAALAAPFALALGVAGGVACVLVGLLLVGRALAATGPDPHVAALGAADRALAAGTLVAALLVGLTGNGLAVAILAALGLAQLALASATRYAAT